MPSKTAICNIALSHLGHGVEIQDVETERTAEAAACRRFYEQARDGVLRDFPWPFARRTVSPGLIEEDPNSEWDYGYRYPADCLIVRRVLSDTRNDSRQSRVPYVIGRDDGGVVIYTDRPDAEVEYTSLVEDPLQFPAEFTEALTFLLASLIAPRVTAGDPFKLGRRAFELYVWAVNKARLQASNEDQVDEQPESEFIRARE